MFDVTSSKLLILGIVALLVIGPKDLPALLRTLGKYMGIIKRQAAEFRAQFDEAMRDSELDQIKKDVERIGQEAEASVRAAEQSVDKEVADARHSVDAAMSDAPPAGAVTHDAQPEQAGERSTGTAAAGDGDGHRREEQPGPVASEGAAGVKTGA
jgi:sec-independent protein translocase protein TatB